MEEYLKRDRTYYNNMSNKHYVHKCNMQDRNKVELSGVKSVESFDTNEVLLDTVLGGLLLKGTQLHINQLNLDKGMVEVEGKVDALVYSDKSPSENNVKGVISRLFR